MNEAFLKAVRWYFIVFFVIVGASAFIIADTSHSIKPIIIGIFAFGVVYVSSVFWQDLSSKVFIISAFLFLGISQLSSYVPVFGYVFLGWDVDWFDPYYTWVATAAVVGIPVMTLVFRRYD